MSMDLIHVSLLLFFSKYIFLHQGPMGKITTKICTILLILMVYDSYWFILICRFFMVWLFRIFSLLIFSILFSFLMIFLVSFLIFHDLRFSIFWFPLILIDFVDSLDFNDLFTVDISTILIFLDFPCFFWLFFLSIISFQSLRDSFK